MIFTVRIQQQVHTIYNYSLYVLNLINNIHLYSCCLFFYSVTVTETDHLQKKQPKSKKPRKEKPAPKTNGQ